MNDNKVFAPEFMAGNVVESSLRSGSWQFHTEWRYSPTMDENLAAIVTPDGFTIAPPMPTRIAQYLVSLHNLKLKEKGV